MEKNLDNSLVEDPSYSEQPESEQVCKMRSLVQFRAFSSLKIETILNYPLRTLICLFKSHIVMIFMKLL